MKTREQVCLNVAGQEIRLEIDPDERVHVENAAKMVSEKYRMLSERAGASAPVKIAMMVAFQYACDLSIANECLDEAEKLAEDLKRQKQAVQRLEKLLTKVDDALTV